MFVLAIVSPANALCQRPCKAFYSVPKLLFWGLTPNRQTAGGITLVQWLSQTVSGAQYDQIDPANATLTAGLLDGYDGFVLAELWRNATDQEAVDLANWLINRRGFVFGLSGWDGYSESDFHNSHLKYFPGRPQYGEVVSYCTSFYPGQPLLKNISSCGIDFVGGYASALTNSTSSSSLAHSYLMRTASGRDVGLSVDLCSPSSPFGGSYVLWGDEWISYVALFKGQPGNAQIWRNIVSYLSSCSQPTCQPVCKSRTPRFLFWGLTPNRQWKDGITLVQYLQNNVDVGEFDQLDPSTHSLSRSILQCYDGFVLSELFRNATRAEQVALSEWVLNGGFFFGLSGWDGGPERAFHNSYIELFPYSPRYTEGVSDCSAFYPRQDLLSGIPRCDIDFGGGFASTCTSSSATYLMSTSSPPGYNVGLSVDLCDINGVGGRYVLWGDEWISYVALFAKKAGNRQIWTNLVTQACSLPDINSDPLISTLALPQCTLSAIEGNRDSPDASGASSIMLRSTASMLGALGLAAASALLCLVSW